MTSTHCRTGSMVTFCIGSGTLADLNTSVFVDHSYSAKENPSIWAVQFCPDDKCVAIGEKDGRIKVGFPFLQCAILFSSHLFQDMEYFRETSPCHVQRA